MAGETVRMAARSDLDRLVAPIVLAFSSDPFVRWLLPDSTGYSATFANVVRLHAEAVVDAGGAYRSEDFRAVALWYPPGIQPDSSALGAIFARALDDTTLDVVSAVFQEMDAFKPTASHMYLRMIGVDPALQGQGYGSALMRAALDECDRRGLPAYLEATSAGSRSLYERHGFSSAAELRVAPAPPIWPMSRSAPAPRQA